MLVSSCHTLPYRTSLIPEESVAMQVPFRCSNPDSISKIERAHVDLVALKTKCYHLLQLLSVPVLSSIETLPRFRCFLMILLNQGKTSSQSRRLDHTRSLSGHILCQGDQGPHGHARGVLLLDGLFHLFSLIDVKDVPSRSDVQRLTALIALSLEGSCQDSSSSEELQEGFPSTTHRQTLAPKDTPQNVVLFLNTIHLSVDPLALSFTHDLLGSILP